MKIYTTPSYRYVSSGRLLALLLITYTVLSAQNAPLTWAPPTLVDPITVTVSNTNRSLKLLAGRDYLIVMPQKISMSNGLTINGQGARNIVLIGGEIDIPHAGTWDSSGEFGNKRRALKIQNWTGTFHLEGVWLHGVDIAEGINVDTRTEGAILQIQNVRVDNVHSRPEEIAVNWSGVHHPDIIQNWGGPTYYRIDRLTGYTDYQGLFMQPTQYGSATEVCDFRNVDLHATNPDAGGAYLLYRAGTVNALNLDNAYVEPRAAQAWRGGAYPETDTAWEALYLDTPPMGNFVPAGVAGMSYVSPGYVSAAPLVYQTESLSVTASSGDPHSIISNYIFTNDAGTFFESNAIGDYVSYTVPYLDVRPYSIRVGIKVGANSGTFQTAMAATLGGSYTACGAPNSQYGTAPGVVEFNLGTYTPAGSAGSKVIRFTVTGKSSSSSSYKLNFDYIKFVPQ